MASSSICLGCGAHETTVLLDLGLQPPSNRFLPVGSEVEDGHNLQFGQCRSCRLLQLLDPMSALMVKSRHTWLAYNEPEGHLDPLVQYLTGLQGLTREARIIGLTYKDDSTLARFNRLGFGNTFRFDLNKDFGLDDPCAGLESIQAAIDDQLCDCLAARHGKADLLLVRHVLEHAHVPQQFLRALRRLLAPGGYLVLELPDCRKFISARDYSFLWEEHITYFSPRTLGEFLQRNGYFATDIKVYPYTLEDSLVAIVRPSEEDKPQSLLQAPDVDVAVALRYAEQFKPTFATYRAFFEDLRATGKRIAIFGAGHLAVKFINLFSLENYVDAVIDDNPHKQGLAMPGSGLPIIGSAALPEFDVCLLSLSPESEQKVLAKQQTYVQSGGHFASIFALSPLALSMADTLHVTATCEK
jgi:SAM-dependent methyltransferase